MPTITATTTMAMSVPRRRLGGVGRRGGGDTIRRGAGGANCCGGDADGHGSEEADGHGSEGADGHGWAVSECHGGDVGCGGGGANCGGEKSGCPGGEGAPSHGAAGGGQPGSGSSDGKSAVGHCSAVTSVPQSTQNRTDSSGRGCPHDGHQRATVPPKSAPPGRLHSVPGPASPAASPATQVLPSSRRQVITRLQGQDSPLEQVLNGVLDDQQRICHRRRVS